MSRVLTQTGNFLGTQFARDAATLAGQLVRARLRTGPRPPPFEALPTASERNRRINLQNAADRRVRRRIGPGEFASAMARSRRGRMGVSRFHISRFGRRRRPTRRGRRSFRATRRRAARPNRRRGTMLRGTRIGLPTRIVQNFRSVTVFPNVSNAYLTGEARFAIGYCVPSLVQGASHVTPQTNPFGLVSMGFWENDSAVSVNATSVEDPYYYDQMAALYAKYMVLRTNIKLYITNNDASGTEDVTIAWRLFKPGEDPTGALGLGMQTPADVQRLIALGNVKMVRLGNRTDNNRNNCSRMVKLSVNPAGFISRERISGQSSVNQGYGVAGTTQIDRPDFVGAQDFRDLIFDNTEHPWGGLPADGTPNNVLDATYTASHQAPVIIFYAWRTSSMDHTSVQQLTITCTRDQTVSLFDRIIPAAS